MRSPHPRTAVHVDTELCQVLRAIGLRSANPVIVTLTPGIHNGAYFEHSFQSEG